jgi:hypothetical protein
MEKMIKEHTIVLETKNGNRFPLSQIKYGDSVFKFYREARNVVLKEI